MNGKVTVGSPPFLCPSHTNLRKNISNKVVKIHFFLSLNNHFSSDYVSGLWRYKKDNMIFFHNRLGI